VSGDRLSTEFWNRSEAPRPRRLAGIPGDGKAESSECSTGRDQRIGPFPEPPEAFAEGLPLGGEPGRVGAPGFRLDPPVYPLRLSQLAAGPRKPGGVEGTPRSLRLTEGCLESFLGLAEGNPRLLVAPPRLFFASSPGLHLLASLCQETPQFESTSPARRGGYAFTGWDPLFFKNFREIGQS